MTLRLTSNQRIISILKSKDKLYHHPDTDLQVTALEEFTDIDFGNEYFCTLKKIGDSIVYSNNHGNMRYVDVNLYYQHIEAFIKRTNIARPFIEIQDYKDLRGRPDTIQKDNQIKYLVDHKDDFIAVIACNVPNWLKLILRIMPKIYNPSRVKIVICKDYSEALQKATDILKDQRTQENKIEYKNIVFKPEWSIEKNGFRFINGVISQKLFFTSFEGDVNFKGINEVEKCLSNLFENGELANTSYIRVADYSIIPNVPLKIRNIYASLILKLNTKYNCKPSKTYVCGASSFIKIAMQIYSSLVMQKFIFVKDVETAFKIINGEKISVSKIEKRRSFKVDRKDIDEIIALGGSLIWDEKTKTNLLISGNNPLHELGVTLSLIQSDLADLRHKEKEQKIELKNSLETSEELSRKLIVSNDETKLLNAELVSFNEQLHAQKEELEAAQSQLLEMNTNLEALVKKRTSKLKRTVAKLNKSVSELDRFVYSASHDLGAPLKSVLGLLNIAKIDQSKSHINQCLNYIENSIYKLEDVIKSLISYSRNNRLEVKKESLSFRKVVDDIIAELAFIPTAEKIEFIVELKGAKEILTDRQRLEMILHNLISNSIKYADLEKSNSKVVVSFNEDDKNYLIEVSDNGIGINDHHKKKIFKMFYRATEKSKGSGLGLFISKEAVVAIGGKIKVNSIFGKGTTFKISLPKS